MTWSASIVWRIRLLNGLSSPPAMLRPLCSGICTTCAYDSAELDIKRMFAH
jgi:hypothetical protein